MNEPEQPERGALANRRRAPAGLAISGCGLLVIVWFVGEHGDEFGEFPGLQLPSLSAPTKRWRPDPPWRGVEEWEPDWTYRTQGPIRAQAALGPGGEVYVGSGDGFLYALDRDGGLRWKKNLGGPIHTTPAIDPAGNVYVGSDSGHFASFTHEGVARFQLVRQRPVDRGVLLDAERGRVLFACGEYFVATTFAGALLFEVRAWEKIFSQPALGLGGQVFVGSQDNRLYAVAADGVVDWTVTVGGDVDSSPVVMPGGDVLFGSDDQHVYRVARNGTIRWSTKLEGMVRSGLTLTGRGGVLVATLATQPQTVELSLREGRKLWAFSASPSDFPDVGMVSTPQQMPDGRVVVGAHDDHVYVLSREGQVQAVLKTGGDVEAAPLIFAGVLYVGSTDGILYRVKVP